MKVRSLWVAIGVVAVLAGGGCSKQVAEPEPDTALSGDLAKMQGAWETVSTNGCTDKCGAVIDGYTIRLRYQETSDSPVLRQNTRLQRIDEKRNLLIIDGGLGAWPYFYGIQDGEEHLELKFFSQQHVEWIRLYLRRVERENS